MSPFGDDEMEEDGPSGAAAALASPGSGAAPKNIPDVDNGGAQGIYEGVSSPSEDDIVSTLAPNAPMRPQASAPTEETTGDDFMSGNFSGGGGGGGGVTQGPSSNMQAPTLPTTPQYQDESGLHQQLEKDMTLDPSQYKPSIGRRGIAALAGALAAFGHNPNAYQIGEGVLDAPLNSAKAQQASRVQVDRQAIADADRTNAQARQGYNDRVQQYGMAERDMRNQGYVNNQNAQAEARRENAQSRANAVTSFQPADPSNPWSGGVATTAGGQKIPNAPPPAAWLKSWSGTPQGKTALLNMTITQRQQAAQKMRLKGNDLKFFVANGKLAEPTERTSINIRENPDGSAVEPRGPRNPDENVEAIVAKATQDKQAFADQWQRLPDGSYASVDGKMLISGPEFNSRIDQFRASANPKLAKYGASIDAQGNVQRGGVPGAQPAQVPQQAQQPQQQQQPAKPQQQQPAQPSSQPATSKPPKATMPPPKGAEGRVKGSDGNWYWFAGNKVLGRSN